MLQSFIDLPMLSQLLLLYFVGITVVAFFAYGLDKLNAQRGSRRISEKKLWVLALLGGSLGALVAMEFFRHKTKKAAFQTVFLCIFFVQLSVVLFLIV